MTTKREQIVNNARTTLTSSVNSSVTTLTLDNAAAAGFPSTGNYRILIDSEIMQVTSTNFPQVTVIRGVESTTAASHTAGVAVFATVTAGGLRQVVADDLLYANSKPLYHSLTDISGNLLEVSDFTWVNQGSATATDVEGTIFLQVPGAAGIAKRGFRLVAPSTPYTVTIGARLALFNDTTGVDGYPQINLGFLDSGTSRFSEWFVALRAGAMLCGVHDMTDTTTFSADQITPFTMTLPEDIWLRIVDNGTLHLWKISHDGVNWIQVHSSSRTSWTANPNQIYWGLDPYQATQAPGQRCTLFHYSIANTAL